MGCLHRNYHFRDSGAKLCSGVFFDPRNELILRHNDPVADVQRRESLFLDQLIRAGPADAQYIGHLRHGQIQRKFIVGLVLDLLHSDPFLPPLTESCQGRILIVVLRFVYTLPLHPVK